ncbi:MAG: sugar ABC transporter permease [Deinococcota bacterium]
MSLFLGIYPVLDTFRISLLQYDLLRVVNEGTPFVGLQNYREAFQNPQFIQALINTIVFTIIAVTVVTSLGLVVSQLLNAEYRGRGVVRMIAMIPWFVPPVVASMIWLWMFQTDRSPINHVLRELNLINTNIKFLTDTRTFAFMSIPMFSVSAVRVWGGLPFVSLFLLAGLQSLPKDIYEAAKIDGAGQLQRFFLITLPLLRPVLSILLVLLTLGGLGHFDINYVMTKGGPQGLTNILSILSYQQAFVFFRFDLASAISTLIIVLTAPLAAYYIVNQVKDQA